MAAPLVCIDASASGTHMPRGTHLEVRGYAGGSFESNVVIEARTVLASGGLAGGTLAMKAMTYAAPDVGMPGGWTTTLDLPASGQPGTVRVTAYFTSPRDGSRVAEASVDIVLD